MSSSPGVAPSSRTSKAAVQRPILPAPIDESGATTPNALENNNNVADPKQKRAQISVACEVCRRRKAKCDGIRPNCGPCEARQFECRYATDPDATRMTTLKRRFETVSQEKRQLEELYEMLRLKSSDEANDLVQRIREGKSVSDVLRSAQQGRSDQRKHDDDDDDDDDEDDDRVHESTNDPLSSKGLTGQVPNYFSIQDLRAQHAQAYHDFDSQRSFRSIRARMRVDTLLTDPPPPTTPPVDRAREHMIEILDTEQRLRHQRSKWLGHVDTGLRNADLAYWTTVTTDDDLLGHLISMFMAWEGPLWLFIDRSTFYPDIVNHRTTFCSSMLLNAMCAFGCHLSPRLVNRNDSPSKDGLGTRFLNEARKLFDARAQPDNLLSVQTALILNMTLNMDADDEAGVAIGEQAVSIARKLDLFGPSPRKPTNTRESQMWRARGMTAWALFNFITFEHYAMRSEPPLHDPPAFAIPIDSEIDRDSVEYFRDYPMPDPAMDHCAQLTSEAYCGLTSIQSAIAGTTFAGDSRRQASHLTPESASATIQKLFNWSAGLPTALQPVADCPPHTLVLHMVFHSIILDLLYPFKDRGEAVIIRTGPSEDSGCTVHHLVTASRKQVADALNQLRNSHGLERGPLIMLQIFLISAIDLRRQIHDPEASRYFVSILRGMREVGQSYYVQRPLLRDLHKTFMDEKIELSDDILAMMVFDDEDGGPDDAAGSSRNQHTSGHGLHYLGISKRLASMDSLVAALTLEDQKEQT